MESIEAIDERIAAAEAAIASLTEELKAKKAELKCYQKMNVTAQKSCEKSAPNSEAGERRKMAHMFYDSLHGM